MGNYLFCHAYIMKALHVSTQRLSRQRKVKRNQFQRHVARMTKEDVDKEKVSTFILMSEAVEMSLSVWWATFPGYLVDVRYPQV